MPTKVITPKATRRVSGRATASRPVRDEARDSLNAAKQRYCCMWRGKNRVLQEVRFEDGFRAGYSAGMVCDLVLGQIEQERKEARREAFKEAIKYIERTDCDLGGLIEWFGAPSPKRGVK